LFELQEPSQCLAVNLRSKTAWYAGVKTIKFMAAIAIVHMAAEQRGIAPPGLGEVNPSASGWTMTVHGLSLVRNRAFVGQKCPCIADGGVCVRSTR
jgi:hypothetical protein